MFWREVELKILVAVTITKTLISTLHKISKTTSQNPLLFLRSYQNAPNKHQFDTSPHKPITNLHHCTTSLSTAPNVFVKISQRTEKRKKNWFYEVLDFVKLLSKDPDIETSKMVHCLVLKTGVFARLPTSTSLLVSYSRGSDFGSSMKLFDDIKYKDAIAWNAMMTMCVENRNFEFAISLFVEMRERGEWFDSGTLVIAMNAVTSSRNLRYGRFLHGLSVKEGMFLDLYLYNSIIDMYAKCGELFSSVNMFELMEVKDHVSWNSIISGCLRNNSPERSLGYFKKAAAIGIHEDVSLSCAIAASTSRGDLDIGEAIHGWGIKLGYTESGYVSVNNAIISFYSESGYPETAEIVIRGMVCKDVISWNSVINGFTLNGMVSNAFGFLGEMQSERLMKPDSVTVVTIVPLCAEFELVREGRSVHAYVIRRNMDSHLLVVNSLMDFYLKCSSIMSAEYLFNAMLDRDFVSWNTIISGYSQLGYYKEAQSIFMKLTSWCSKCSLSTLLAILPSCCSSDSLEFGKTIHSWQLKLGFSNNILAINALMFMYINFGDLKAAFSLLASVYEAADTASWNTLITGCSQNGYSWKALETFNLMKKYNVNHDRITLSNVISACGNLGLEAKGKLLHGLSFKSAEGTDIWVQNALITLYGELGDTKSANLVFISIHNHNLCSWNCIISVLLHNKDYKKALEMFRSLDTEPNEITISSVLSACTQLGLLSHGSRQIHAYTFKFSLQLNPYISASLVDMYSNCGRLENSLQVFQSLPNKSVVAWNSMISAHGYHNDSQNTIRTFNEMIEYGTKPTKITFINILSACSHLGLVDEGKWYYDNMLEKFGVEHETEHQVCMVDMLGRSGKLDEAHTFIERLPDQPEPGVWGSLLSACGYYGDLDMGKEVAEILFRLEPDNTGYYVSLFNMYVAAGRWDDAAKVRRIIEEKRLKKPVGISLIDVH